jgi:hypothetical protein
MQVYGGAFTWTLPHRSHLLFRPIDRYSLIGRGRELPSHISTSHHAWPSIKSDRERLILAIGPRDWIILHQEPLISAKRHSIFTVCRRRDNTIYVSGTDVDAIPDISSPPSIYLLQFDVGVWLSDIPTCIQTSGPISSALHFRILYGERNLSKGLLQFTPLVSCHQAVCIMVSAHGRDWVGSTSTWRNTFLRYPHCISYVGLKPKPPIFA